MSLRHGLALGHQKLSLGIALVLVAVITMTIQDLVFKRFVNELSLWQIFSLRGVLATTMLLVVLLARRSDLTTLKSALAKWPLLRSVLMTLALLCFYAAFPFVSLATAGTALYVAPIVVLILSTFLIKEAIGPLGWVSVAVGFVGVVVLLQPASDAFSPWTLLPLAGAGFYGLSHIVTCTKCQKVPMASMTLSVNLVMGMFGLAVSALLLMFEPVEALAKAHPFVFGHWSAVGATDWLLLVLLAIFSVVIGVTLTGAYQVASPSAIATFEYSYLIFAVFWDLIFFQIVPTGSSMLGMLMIVIAGMMVLQRSPRRSGTPGAQASATA